jgi:hypothetical protein
VAQSRKAVGGIYGGRSVICITSTYFDSSLSLLLKEGSSVRGDYNVTVRAQRNVRLISWSSTPVNRKVSPHVPATWQFPRLHQSA